MKLDPALVRIHRIGWTVAALLTVVTLGVGFDHGPRLLGVATIVAAIISALVAKLALAVAKFPPQIPEEFFTGPDPDGVGHVLREDAKILP